MSDWDKVMQAYYKQTARNMARNEARKASIKQHFSGLGDRMTCEEVQEIFFAGGYILDVRNPVDYMVGGRVHNAVNVPSVLTKIPAGLIAIVPIPHVSPVKLPGAPEAAPVKSRSAMLLPSFT